MGTRSCRRRCPIDWRNPGKSKGDRIRIQVRRPEKSRPYVVPPPVELPPIVPLGGKPLPEGNEDCDV